MHNRDLKIELISSPEKPVCPAFFPSSVNKISILLVTQAKNLRVIFDFLLSLLFFFQFYSKSSRLNLKISRIQSHLITSITQMFLHQRGLSWPSHLKHHTHTHTQTHIHSPVTFTLLYFYFIAIIFTWHVIYPFIYLLPLFLHHRM